MSVPEFVMNSLAPLMTHEPSSQSGGGAGPAGVAARARLGEAEGAQRLARAEAGEPFLLLALVAEAEDRHGAERDPGLERDGDGLVDPAELLEGQAEDEEVPAHAAVLLGKGQAEESHLTHLPHDVVGEGLGGVVVGGHRGDHVTGERLHGLAQLLLLVVETDRVMVPTSARLVGVRADNDSGRAGPAELLGHPEARGAEGRQVDPGLDPRPSSCQTRSSVARLPVALPA